MLSDVGTENKVYCPFVKTAKIQRTATAELYGPASVPWSCPTCSARLLKLRILWHDRFELKLVGTPLCSDLVGEPQRFTSRCLIRENLIVVMQTKVRLSILVQRQGCCTTGDYPPTSTCSVGLSSNAPSSTGGPWIHLTVLESTS